MQNIDPTKINVDEILKGIENGVSSEKSVRIEFVTDDNGNAPIKDDVADVNKKEITELCY